MHCCICTVHVTRSLNVNINTCTTSASQVKIYLKSSKRTPTCFGLRPSSGSYNVLAKIIIILTTVGCFYA